MANEACEQLRAPLLKLFDSRRFLKAATSHQRVRSSAQQLADPSRARQWIELGELIDEVVDKGDGSGVKVVLWRTKLGAPDASVRANAIGGSNVLVQSLDRFERMHDCQRNQCIA